MLSYTLFHFDVSNPRQTKYSQIACIFFLKTCLKILTFITGGFQGCDRHIYSLTETKWECKVGGMLHRTNFESAVLLSGRQISHTTHLEQYKAVKNEFKLYILLNGNNSTCTLSCCSPFSCSYFIFKYFFKIYQYLDLNDVIFGQRRLWLFF